MNLSVIIVIAIITIILLYVILKPYFIKYHSTLLFTGELGGGKTLNAVKTAIKVYKKTCFNIKIQNFINKQINKIVRKHNKNVDSRINKGKTKHIAYWDTRKIQPKPRLISNIPILINKRKKIWSNVLTKDMLLLKERASEYSVFVIDEIPQLINQFNWNIEEVQHNVNEFATFFRHYYDGLLILTAQSDSQVVKQLRDKMNQFYWLSNFHKFLFFFYKCDICQFISSDVVGNVNTGFVEDNTKTIYGTLFTKHYDSRCYRNRLYILPETEYYTWCKYKTNKIIRFDKNYTSPLDTKEIK